MSSANTSEKPEQKSKSFFSCCGGNEIQSEAVVDLSNKQPDQTPLTKLYSAPPPIYTAQSINARPSSVMVSSSHKKSKVLFNYVSRPELSASQFKNSLQQMEQSNIKLDKWLAERSSIRPFSTQSGPNSEVKPRQTSNQ